MVSTLVKNVVSAYLYGGSRPANLLSDALIRADSSGANISIDGAQFMNQSGGRFVKPSEFEVVQKFFAASSSLTTGSYTLSQIMTKLGTTAAKNTISVDQKQFSSGTDYFDRVFVFNNTGFKLEDSAELKFVVDANGTRHIQNIKVIPQTDNFDFIGGDATTGTLNTAIRPFIDPSDDFNGNKLGIGRKTTLSFTGNIASEIDYTRQEYINDTLFVSNEKGPAEEALLLGPQMAIALNDLWADGITKFLDPESRPILYGTNSNDTLLESNLTNLYNNGSSITGFGIAVVEDLLTYRSNGVVLFGGKGNDNISGGIKNDKIYGGADKDILFGLQGNNTLDGGSENDILVAGGQNDSLIGGSGKDIFAITGTGSYIVDDTGNGDYLLIDGMVLEGEATDNGDGSYTLSDLILQRVGANLSITGLSSSGPVSINILNWSEGDYSIKLQPKLPSPIVLDLDRDGIELIELWNNRRFDIDGDGFRESTGWVNKDDGFLVIDKNNNGLIDDVNEMFGDNGGSTAWDKMKIYDSNKDGNLSSGDANWSKLRIWKDLNSNAHTETNELYSLASLGIRSINLGNDGYSTTDWEITQGNPIYGRGTWTTTTGSQGYYYDVYFNVAQDQGLYNGNGIKGLNVDPAQLFNPQLSSYGVVVPTYAAYTNNPSLLAIINSLKTIDKSALQSVNDAKIADFIIKWAGTDNITAGSRGTGVDAKAVTASEMLLGFTKNSGAGLAEEGRPWSSGKLTIEEIDYFKYIWHDQIADIRQSLFIQTAYANIFPNSYYSFPLSHIVYNDSVESILNRAKTFAPGSTDMQTQSFYWSGIFNLIEMGGEYRTTLGGKTSFNEDQLRDAILKLAPTGTAVANNYDFVADGASSPDRDYESHFLIGSDGNNTLNGGYEYDVLLGNGGNDYLFDWYGGGSLIGGAGDDTIRAADVVDFPFVDGGSGSDTLYLIAQYNLDTVTIDLIAGTYTFNSDQMPAPETYLFKNIENIIYMPAHVYGKTDIFGTEGNNTIQAYPWSGPGIFNYYGKGGNDKLIGSDSTDMLSGGAGNDTIQGGKDIDTLVGGSGVDVLTGGAGNDVFDFNLLLDSSKAAFDRLTDFDLNGDDKIDLRGLGFTGFVSGAATGTKLGVTFDAVANKTTIVGVSDFKLLLDGHPTIDASDFIFV